VFIFLIIELLFLVTIIVLEFTSFKYSTLNKKVQITIRVLMILPLILFLLTSGDFNIYKILLIIALSIAIIADILITYSFIFGLASFFIVHSILLSAFIMQIQSISINSFLILIPLIIMGLIIYFKVFFENIKSNKIIAIALGIYLLLMISEIWASIVGTKGIILISGITLFFLCDVQVAYINFKRTFSLSQQINHILYYGGLILITISGVIA
jgi:hypothetical protein